MPGLQFDGIVVRGTVALRNGLLCHKGGEVFLCIGDAGGEPVYYYDAPAGCRSLVSIIISLESGEEEARRGERGDVLSNVQIVKQTQPNSLPFIM